MSGDRCDTPGCVWDPGPSGLCPKCRAAAERQPPLERALESAAAALESAAAFALRGGGFAPDAPTAFEKRLYDLVPIFVERCMTIRAAAPCDLLTHLSGMDVPNWHVQGDLLVTRTGVLIVQGALKRDFTQLPAAERLEILSQAQQVFHRLLRATESASELLAQAEKALY